MSQRAMQDQGIEIRVRRAIAEDQQMDIETVRPDASFEELGIDSFDGVSLLYAIETEFDINVPDEAARELRGIPDVVEGVERILAEKARSTDS